MGKVFRKAFRILGLDERESGTTGSGTRFSWKFSGECNMFFCLFLQCPRLNFAHSGMV